MLRLFPVSFALLAMCVVASAGAIDVSYTVSGSAGAWDLNFTVVNNLTAWPSQDVYEFGVQLGGPAITGSPTGYDPNAIGSVNNFFFGGSPIAYDNIWADFNDFNHLLPGTSLSGFTVQVADVSAPTSVPWFGYSVANTFDPADIYTGTDAFAIDFDGSGSAGFEGLATAQAADSPEPASFGLLIIGLGSGILVRRRLIRGSR